jgi:hypothetical protein
MKNVFCILALPLSCLLTSCFFNQNAPDATTQSASSAPANGVVVMEDVTSISPQAAIAAQFVPPSSSQSQVVRHMRTLRNSEPTFSFFKLLVPSLGDGPQCSAGTVPNQSETVMSSGPSAEGLLDAGALTYGAALQTTMLPVSENSENDYFQQMSPGFPAGPYQIQAAGSSDVNAFTDLLPMPEELNGVSFNGVSNEVHDMVTVSKAAGLTIQWSVALPNGLNQIFAEVRSPVSSDQQMVIQCGDVESDFQPQTAGTPSQWVIPPSLLESIPLSDQAEVRLIRINDHQGTNPGPTQGMDFQGIRRYAVEATIAN